tara:strand:- start:236 stop:583 length:348 start_codon:yes stop_codon:yes gene_type:complete
MKNQELILNNTNIKALFMREDVSEILITRDLEAFNLSEENSTTLEIISAIEDFEWFVVVDFGLKNIICDWMMNIEKVPYDKVTAVIVRYNDADKDGNEVETFINKNFTEVIKINN